MVFSVRNLYNQPAMASIRELVYRRLGLQLDPKFITIISDGANSKVTVQALVKAADGTRAPYLGSYTYPVVKLNINKQLPVVFVWSDLYPPTVNALADYLLKTHGYYLEDGEFYAFGDSTQTPLVRGNRLPNTLDASTQTFKLSALPACIRWITGGQLTFELATPNSIIPAGQFGVSGNVPDATVGKSYSFTYLASGGTAPYTYAVTQGTSPFPLDSSTGRLYFAKVTVDQVGSHTWIVTATGANGHTATIRSTMTVIAQPLVMSPPNAAPAIFVGTQASIDLGVSGGVQPYTYEITAGSLPDTAAIVGTAIVGSFNGANSATSYQLPLQIKVTDAQGASASRLITPTVSDRSDANVVASLKTKLSNWYATVGDYSVETNNGFVNGDTWVDQAGQANLHVHGTLPVVMGPGGRHGIDFTNGYAQALAAIHNFVDPFTVVMWYNPVDLVGNEHVVSKGADNYGGWAVTRTGDGKSLTLALNLSGVLVDSPFMQDLTSGWSMDFVQFANGVPSLSASTPIETDNAPLSGAVQTNSTEFLTLGQNPAITPALKFTGKMADVVLFTNRIWSDERKWFYQNGAGRNFWELIVVPNQTLTGTLGNHTVGDSVAFTYLSSGGVVPYRWYISGGALPTGLSIDTVTGLINGAVTAAGTFTWTVELIDLRGVAVYLTDTSTINYQKLTLVGPAPVSGTQGTPYSTSFNIAGGDGVYSNPRLSGATMPPGLTLSIVSGNIFQLSGTPTAAYNGSGTLMVDSGDLQTASLAVTLSIAASGNTNYPALKEYTLSLNPTAYWRLGEGAGATIAVDQTGLHNATYGTTGLTLGSPGMITAESATSAGTAGTGYIAQTPGSADFYTPIASIMVVIEPSFTQPGRILSVGDRVISQQQGFDFYYQVNGTLGFVYWGSGGSGYVATDSAPGVLTAGVRTKVGARLVSNGTSAAVDLFVNGVKIKSVSGLPPYVMATAPVAWIGSLKESGPDYFFKGVMQDLAFFTYGLTDAQFSTWSKTTDAYLVIVGTYPAATTNTAYDEALVIGGGSAAYNNLKILSGAVPTGMSLAIVNATLVLSGTPTDAAGTAVSFMASVDSSSDQTATSMQSFTLNAVRQSYISTVLADNPVGYWPCTETTGTVLEDLSGNGHNGVITVSSSVQLNAPPLRAGSTGSLATSARIDLAAVVNLAGVMPKGTQWSLELIGRRTPNTDHFWATMLCTQVGYGSEQGDPGIYANGGWAGRGVYGDATTVSGTTDATLPAHVVMERDMDTLNLYVNGLLESTRTLTSWSSISDNLYLLGSADYAGSYGVIGQISDVAIYDHALGSKRAQVHSINAQVLSN